MTVYFEAGIIPILNWSSILQRWMPICPRKLRANCIELDSLVVPWRVITEISVFFFLEKHVRPHGDRRFCEQWIEDWLKARASWLSPVFAPPLRAS